MSRYVATVSIIIHQENQDKEKENEAYYEFSRNEAFIFLKTFMIKRVYKVDK